MIGLAILVWVLYKGCAILFPTGPGSQAGSSIVHERIVRDRVYVRFGVDHDLVRPGYQVPGAHPIPYLCLALVAAHGIGYLALAEKAGILETCHHVDVRSGLLSMFASSQVIAVQDFRKGGDAFAGERWFASEAIAALETDPARCAHPLQ